MGEPSSTDGRRKATTTHRTVRDAWTAPAEEELAWFEKTPRMLTPTLTRISRNPLHLAAFIQWAIRNGYALVTPNVLVTAEEVGYRLLPVAPPSTDAKRVKPQSYHHRNWRDAVGLSAAHAKALGLKPAGTRRPRRNPCPCGSGVKHKRCHGR